MKKRSYWLLPKATLPELESFLTSVERALFCSTKPNDVKYNLSEEEKSASKK